MLKMNQLLFVLTLTTPLIESARILAVIPTVSKSHYAAARNILLAMAKRHEVVVISPFEEKNPPEGWRWIHLKINSFEEAVPNVQNSIQEVSFFAGQHRLWDSMNTYTDYIINLPDIKNFIQNDNSHFDLVIIEEFFQQAFYTFAFKYNAPLVLLSSFGNGHYINEYIGNALEISSVPHEFAFFYGEMDIIERAENLVYTLYDLVMRRFVYLSHQNNISKTVFGIKNAPHVEELEKDAALVLVNAHFSINVVQPYLPNMIQVAGVHIDEPKDLDQEFKTILDGAKHGALLFSFGSIVELAKFPENVTIPILKALGRIKQEVLLKWNSDDPPPISFENVHTFKWLPQNDILAHPNIQAFVTHGGLLGAQEAIHHAVPSICIPFYGDQTLNCQRSVKLGYGLHIPNKDLTEDLLYNGLQEMLSNKKYKDSVEILSKQFKDRPMNAIDTAVFWIEYVIRHKGAEFFKGPKRNLYWFQILYLDLLVVIFLVLILIRRLMKKVYANLFGRQNVKRVDLRKKRH